MKGQESLSHVFGQWIHLKNEKCLISNILYPLCWMSIKRKSSTFYSLIMSTTVTLLIEIAFPVKALRNHLIWYNFADFFDIGHTKTLELNFAWFKT